MQLFRLSEPTNGEEPAGLRVALEPNPHIFFGDVPGVGPFSIPLAGALAEAAQIALAENPAHLLYAGDLSTDKEKQICFRTENHWNSASSRKRAALVHLDTEVGDGGALILTGPKGAPEVTGENGKAEVVRNFLKFSDSAGVKLLTDDFCTIGDNGRVGWKDETIKNSTPFLLISMLKGASFRVLRTGELEGAAKEFTVYWSGTQLLTKVFVRDSYRRRYN